MNGNEIIKYVLIQPKLSPNFIGKIVNKVDTLISKVRQALVIAKYVIPFSLKAVNGVVVPGVSIKGSITKLAHVKPVPKFLYAFQQKPTLLSKNLTTGCLNNFDLT